MRLETQGQQLSQSIQNAQTAQKTCAENQEAYETYLQGQKLLQGLQQKRDKYVAIQKQFQDCQQKLNQAKVRESSLLAQLEGFTQLEAQAAQLQAKIPLQEKLEQQLREQQQQNSARKGCRSPSLFPISTASTIRETSSTTQSRIESSATTPSKTSRIARNRSRATTSGKGSWILGDISRLARKNYSRFLSKAKLTAIAIAQRSKGHCNIFRL